MHQIGLGRMAGNSLRLGLTLGLGMATVILVSTLGQGAFALFLYLLGWRWAVQSLVDGAEAGSVSLLADGTPPDPRDLTRLAAGVGLILCLGGLLGLHIAPTGYQGALWAGVVGNAIVVGCQIRGADRLGQWIAAGQMGRYNLQIVARRAVDCASMGVAVTLWAQPEGALICAAALQGLGALGLYLLLPARSDHGPVAQAGVFWRRVRQSAELGAAGSLSLRGPAVLLPILGGADLGAMAGILLLFLGYARQVGSALLAGLDGALRKAQPGQGGPRNLVVKSTLILAALGGLLVGMTMLFGPRAVDLIAPDEMGRGRDWVVLGLQVGVAGAALRLVGDGWGKALAAYGALGRSPRRAVALAFGHLGAASLAAVLSDPGPALVLTAASYTVVQVSLVAFVLGPALWRSKVMVRTVRPSSPAG